MGVFADRGVGALIHAGDVCSPFALREFEPLAARGVRMHAVFGNNDGDRVMLVRKGADFCVFHDGAAVFELGGRRIVVTHYPDLAPALLASGLYDLVIHGHDHQVRVEGESRRLLNPGSCAGYRRRAPRWPWSTPPTCRSRSSSCEFQARPARSKNILDRGAVPSYKESGDSRSPVELPIIWIERKVV